MKTIKKQLISLFRYILQGMWYIIKKSILVVSTIMMISWTAISGIAAIIVTIPFWIVLRHHKQFKVYNVALFTFSLLMLVVLYPIGFIYEHLNILLFPKPTQTRGEVLSNYYRSLAISHDQTGNVVLRSLFNDLLLSKNSKNKFGNPDETISSVLGKNFVDSTLVITGVFLSFILDIFDAGHVVNSIEEDEQSLS